MTIEIQEIKICANLTEVYAVDLQEDLIVELEYFISFSKLQPRDH